MNCKYGVACTSQPQEDEVAATKNKVVKKKGEVTQPAAIVLAGENWRKQDQERMAHMQCIARLRIETKTGMRHSSGSTIELAKRLFPKVVTNRTKAGALRQLEDHYETLYGRKYGESSTLATVAKGKVFQRSE